MTPRFFICLLLMGLISAAELSALKPRPFIWWSAAAAERLADGRVRQALTLESGSGFKLERPEALYRITPLKRFNQLGQVAEARWQAGEWASDDPWRLVLEAGEYVSVDLFAKAFAGGRPCFAQTRVFLFSNAGKGGESRNSLAKGPGWPEFQVTSDGEIYWPQIGHEFAITLAGGSFPATGELSVVNEGGEVLAELPPLSGVFKYRPARDPVLDLAGQAASKPLIFLAHDEDGGSASFTLAVHRSRTAGLDLKAGLMLFTAVLGAALLVAGLARRKAAPCF